MVEDSRQEQPINWGLPSSTLFDYEVSDLVCFTSVIHFYKGSFNIVASLPSHSSLNTGNTPNIFLPNLANEEQGI